MSSCTNSREGFVNVDAVEFQAQFIISSRMQQEVTVTADIRVQMFRSTSVYHNIHLKSPREWNADSDTLHYSVN